MRAVDAHESGRHAAEALGILLLLQVPHRYVDDAADVLHLLAYVALDGVVHLGLGLVDEVVNGDGLVVSVAQDVVGSGDEVALYSLLLEYLDVILHVRGAAHFLRQARQGHGASHDFKIAVALELVADGDDVDGSVVQHQGAHSFENHTVLLVVEARGGELLHCKVHAGGLYEHSTKDRLFNVKSLRGFITHLKPYHVEVGRRAALPLCGLGTRSCHYSGFWGVATMMRPQCSQITRRLPEAISMRR